MENLENFRTPIAIYLDLSKAFDTLDFNIYLHQLNHFGISGNALTWFKSYLYNKKQCVQIENTKSHTIQITTGVPQCSILGPLLFRIYINDIKKMIAITSFLYYMLMIHHFIVALLTLNKQVMYPNSIMN